MEPGGKAVISGQETEEKAIKLSDRKAVPRLSLYQFHKGGIIKWVESLTSMSQECTLCLTTTTTTTKSPSSQGARKSCVQRIWMGMGKDKEEPLL